MRGQAANAITLSRLALTAPFAWAVLYASGGGSGWPAALFFTLLAGSDLLDGWVARRLAIESGRGRLLDHGADIVFLLTALGVYGALDVVPWWVPAAIASSFAVYTFDAWRGMETQAPLASRIGHIGGVLNYALVGCLVSQFSLRVLALPDPALCVFFAAVPVYSLGGVVARIVTHTRAQTRS